MVLSDDYRYEACAPRTCSDVQFSNPFWISGQQPPYCGEPAFEISCEDNRPTLLISGKKFTAKNVFYSNNSLLLIDDIMYREPCGMPLSNWSLDGTPFDVSPQNQDLYIFYNCSTPSGLNHPPSHVVPILPSTHC
ncbi:hypothetical protein MLD38_030131 [Melastoma candidum]|uniref:Uncharacterized protein n=1 Tax=Melastoma candidum TaxID=119954 RepID=A0ACB9MMM3_9MYRT|nr:hypothetical protein MLD38_030131 [Melastoma candidum]